MIEHLALANFKAFQHLSLELSPLTLLAGLNSSGKSTVLQALAMLRQSHSAGTLDGRDDDAGLLLNGELVELGVGKDVRHEAWTADDEAEGAIEIEFVIDDRLLRWSAAYGTEDDLLTLSPIRTTAGHDEEIPLFGRSFQYLKADRITPAVSYPRSHQIAVRQGFLGSRGEHTVNYLRSFQDEPVVNSIAHHPEASSITLLSQTEAWLRELCPGVNLVSEGIEGTDTVRLSYRLGSAGISSSNAYRPTNVGFGLTYVLPIIVACLSAGQDGLLLLENPEAHLHPRGQTAMARLIAYASVAGAQVIVETHSDHILNGVRLAVKEKAIPSGDVSLHYFDRSGDRMTVSSPRITEDGLLTFWPDGFFDEWDRSLDKLID